MAEMRFSGNVDKLSAVPRHNPLNLLGNSNAGKQDRDLPARAVRGLLLF